MELIFQIVSLKMKLISVILHQAHHCLIINTIIMRKIHYLKIVFLRIRLISIILKLPIIFILTMLTLKIMLIFTSVNLKKQLVFMG